MDPDRSAPRAKRRRASSWANPWFTGLTWRGLAIVAAICVVNGTRRKIADVAASPWPDLLIETLQLSALGLLIAVPVAVALVVTWNLAPAQPGRRYAMLALSVALSSFVGVAAHFYADLRFMCGETSSACYGEPWPLALLRSWVRYGTIAALGSAVFVHFRITAESVERALDAEAGRARYARQMEEAHLRVLQAQIEPHFLFNTLANVRRLYQTGAPAAEAMLDNLMRYLEVALPQMRTAASTLGREAALCEAYLAIQRIRMGPRLTFAIDVPEALRDVPLPPMMLLTLVENAIKHGIAHLPEGGDVRIGATLDGTDLRVRVDDSGGGFAQTSGTGTGLANVRARLRGLYGAAGRLDLSHRSPQGVSATITLPHDPNRDLARMS
ncbi:MAG TPA: histidine kinase [Casimicrobiaceae bacterium]|nr:histidine kinase [Casimicrobiaceae bacterium]